MYAYASYQSEPFIYEHVHAHGNLHSAQQLHQGQVCPPWRHCGRERQLSYSFSRVQAHETAARFARWQLKDFFARDNLPRKVSLVCKPIIMIIIIKIEYTQIFTNVIASCCLHGIVVISLQFFFCLFQS